MVDVVSTLDDYTHSRYYLSRTQSPLKGAPSLALGLGQLRHAAGDADLLHIVGDTATLLCMPLVGSRTVVWGTHGLSLLRRLHGIRERLVRRRIGAAVGVARSTICSSRAELDELAAFVGPVRAERLVEVPNGVRLNSLPSAEDRESARADFGLRDDELAALYLGELAFHKRPLIAADAALQASGSAPVVLLVGGDGPLAGDLAERAGGAVRPLGFRNDVQRLLTAADVLVMPSAGEGMSLALLEAMGAGLAIVASDIPAQVEALGDAAILCPVDDTAAIATALIELAADPGRRASLGEAARSRVEGRFTLDRFLRDMDSVFRAALGS